MTALLLLASLLGTPSATESNDRIGTRIEHFTLPDCHGKECSSAGFADKQVLVVAFIGVECPLARVYAPKFQKIATDFAGRAVQVLLIDSNRQDAPAEIADFAKSYALSMPVLVDKDANVADLFAAVRTPEVFVLDKDRVLRYRGRIDDQFGFGLTAGYAKPRLNSDDLLLALGELLDGKEVSAPRTKADGCFIGRAPKASPKGDVTYTKHVAAILQDRCVECHRPGQVAPFSLTNYEETIGWGDTILEVVDQGRMPPWSASPDHGRFANDCRLTDDQKESLRTWIKNGMPEGDKRDLPPPRHFAEGWRIGEPDAVFYIKAKPYKVPAEGVVAYQYFTVDPGFTKDVWIQKAEARPGNRAVVHHIIAFALPPGGISQLRGGDEASRTSSAVAAYAPGSSANILPDGVAMLVKAGTRFIFQMHYTPNGAPAEDRSALGVVFADPKTVKKRIQGGGVSGRYLRIPPNADNHTVEASIPIRRDILLLTMSPHMHLRGKSFRYVAKYPDGKEEILLDVPKYDFNWQMTYELAEPKRLPAGSTLRCIAHFDNSTANPANPDPARTVHWGPQTWDEMMIGFFKALPVDDNGPASPAG